MRANLTMICLALLVGLLGPAGGHSLAEEGGKPPAAGMGVLTGVVSRWPMSPVQGLGQPPTSAPAPGIRLLVYGPRHQEVATVLTDKAGKYRLELRPGNYAIEMESIKGQGFSKDLPATVTITPGRETRLNVRIDTGIR